MSPILGIWASQISGHLWAPAGAYDALATITPSSAVATVTFVGIPQGYKHLQLRCFTSQSASNASNSSTVAFNGDTTNSNYYWHRLLGNGSAASATASQIRRIMDVSGSNTYPASTIIDILDYSSTNKNKTVRVLNGLNDNGTNTWDEIVLSSLLWNNTAAINSIALTVDGGFNWNTVSQFALYGVK